MADPGTTAAALAFVPNWWQDAPDPAALDPLLVGWAAACGWRACGLVWPAGDGPAVCRTVRAGSLADVPPPPEAPDALRRLRAGEQTVLYPAAGTGGRVFAGVSPAGRASGVVWAERAAGVAWDDATRAYLALTARAMERSPAVAAAVGSGPDPDRLSQRIADAAVIAGRMAHDFNNILTGIIGFSDLTLPMLQPGTPAANYVAEIGKAGQRGIAFVDQLHQLSRSGQVKPGAAAVAAAVAKEEARLKPAAGPGVRFERDVPPGLPAVAVEAGALGTVLGHLMGNAAEACLPGGVVRVTVRAADLSEAEARGYLGRAGAGPHVAVAVSDTGPGVDPQARPRLLAEPFHTTKARHRGLGLATAYRALWAHRAGLSIESVPPPGTGTLVRVVLPVAAARPPAAAGTPAGHPAAAGSVSPTAVGG